MRIISGKFRGLRFSPPDGIPTRPTTDIAKEGLFNILNNNIEYENTKFLDLFGGSGNISYEMASRGCTDITIVDLFPKCADYILKMSEKLGIEGIRVLEKDVFDVIENSTDQYDLIFAGPPYGLDILDDIPNRIFSKSLLVEGGIFVLEHNPHHNFDDHPQIRDKRNYGQTIFSFFVNS